MRRRGRRWGAEMGAALVLAVTTACGSGGSSGPGFAVDRVRGGGKLVYTEPGITIFSDVTIDAETLTPFSTLAIGDFFLQQGDWWKGKVTSLVVVGDTAVAGGVITDSSDPSYLARGFYEVVVDVDASGTADRSQTIFLPPGNPPAWEGEIPVPIFVMTSGDYVVFDG